MPKLPPRWSQEAIFGGRVERKRHYHKPVLAWEREARLRLRVSPLERISPRWPKKPQANPKKKERSPKKMTQDGRTTRKLRLDGPRWPQVGQDRPKMAPSARSSSPRSPEETLGPHKMAPRCPQDWPRWPQEGPKYGQDGPKMAPRPVKIAPRSPKIATRWPLVPPRCPS